MRETTLEEICTIVGYTATRVLQAWYSERTLYVPVKAAAEHPLATLLGMSALRRLVDACPGAMLKVPSMSADNWAVRDRKIALMLADGAPVADIAAEMGLQVRRVQQIRAELVLRGWVIYAEQGRSRRRPPVAPDLIGQTAG